MIVPPPTTTATEPIVEMTDISITFGAVRALDGVSLRLYPARSTR